MTTLNGTEDFGSLLRDLRRASGLSLEQFAAKHGVTAVTVGSYERNQRRPRIDQVAQLLGVFGFELRAVPKGTPPAPGVGGVHVWTPQQIADVLASIAEFLAPSAPDPTSLAVLREKLVEQRAGGAA